MALSGIILGSYSGGTTYKPYLKWAVTQDIAALESTMSVTFGMYKAKTSTLSYNINPRTVSVVVNGTTYNRSVGFDFRDKAVGTYNDMFTIEGIVLEHTNDGNIDPVPMSATHSTGISLATGKVSGEADVSAIPRTTTPVLSSTEIPFGETITISLSPAKTSFTHKLKYSFGGKTATFAESVSTSATWTLPKSFAEYIPNALSGAGSIICETYDGTTLLGTKAVGFTAIIPDTEEFYPSLDLSGVSITDATAGLAAKFGDFVQNKSQLAISIPNSSVQGAYGSTITKRETSVNGRTYTGDQITTSILSVAGTLSVLVEITDSRGRITKKSKSIEVIPYSNPVITAFSVFRSNAAGELDEAGENVAIYVAYAIASVNGKNDRNYRISYKRTSDTSYTVATTATAATSFEGVIVTPDTLLSTDYPWDIKFEIWDYFTSGNPIARYQPIETEEVIMDFNASGKGLAIGKVSEKDGVEIAWEVDAQSDFTANGKITVPEPTTTTDAASKGYVDTSLDSKMLLFGAVPKYFGTADYAISASDAGKILLPSYSIRNSTIVATLDSSVTLGMAKGTEIAVVRLWGANLTIKTTGIRMAVPGVTSNGVGGITTADEQQFVIPKPFGTAVLKKLDQDSNGEVWVLQGDVEMLNFNNRTLTITAGQSVPINLKPGQIMQVAYLTSSQAAANITLKVNGAAPDGGYYTPAQENNTYSGGIITYGGSTALATAQFSMQIVNDRLIVWGTGIRGNGSGFGTFNAFWKTTAPTSFSISHAGTVVYKKLQ